MTMVEFIRKICEVARNQEHAVLAVAFEPAKEGLSLWFRFRDPQG